MRIRARWASTTRSWASRALTASMRRCASERGRTDRVGPASGLLGQHAHVQALLGALLLELHPAGHLGEQRMVAADTDVRAGTDRRAALAHEDVPGEHLLAPEAL